MITYICTRVAHTNRGQYERQTPLACSLLRPRRPPTSAMQRTLEIIVFPRPPYSRFSFHRQWPRSLAFGCDDGHESDDDDDDIDLPPPTGLLSSKTMMMMMIVSSGQDRRGRSNGHVYRARNSCSSRRNITTCISTDPVRHFVFNVEEEEDERLLHDSRWHLLYLRLLKNSLQQ